jgi:predicted transposase/invertase (TIGR01784 family)
LHQLKKLPRILDQKVFQRIFKLAQLTQLPKEEQLMYDRTLKAKRDWHNMLDYAQKEAIKKGMEKRTIEIAIALFDKGIDINTISEITQLPTSTINAIIKK